MANILGSANNLFAAVNRQADAVATIAKGALCLPAIISSLPSILGGLAATVGRSLLANITSAISTISGIIESAANEIISTITGQLTETLNQVLSLQAQITQSIRGALDLVNELAGKVQDVRDFVSDSENCKFAGSEFLKCIVSEITKDISSDIKGVVTRTLDIKQYSNRLANKVSQPGEFIDKYVSKQSSMLDKATKQLDAITLF